MTKVNALIATHAGSDVTMIPEVADLDPEGLGEQAPEADGEAIPQDPGVGLPEDGADVVVGVGVQRAGAPRRRSAASNGSSSRSIGMSGTSVSIFSYRNCPFSR